MDFLLIGISTLLIMLVAGNNTSAIVGVLIASKMLNKNLSLLLAIFGYIIGLLAQGIDLKNASAKLFPNSSVLIFALVITLSLFLMANIWGVPLSLTMALVGTAYGFSLHYHYSIPYIYLIIEAWIIAPVLSLVISYLINSIILNRKFSHVWNYTSTIKLSLIVISFFTAYTLGANTIGFIVDIVGFNFLEIGAACIGIVVGTFLLSKSTIRTVGEKMYLMKYISAFSSQLISAILVEIATFLSIPLSNTQTLTASVLGAGLSYKSKIINIRPFLFIVLMWFLSPLLGAILAFLV
ncbi:MAG: anion permease [Sulfolobus sp.]|nr:anion permease [Sulfolobus sp.]